MSEPVRNRDVDWNWSPQALSEYTKVNYANMLREDKMLTHAAIAALSEDASTRSSFQWARSALHIGVGNVLRGSALIAPLMDSADSQIIMGDIGKETLKATRTTIRHCKDGNLRLWQQHQDHMSLCNDRWRGAFQKAATIAKVRKLDIHYLPVGAFDIVTTEHTPESLTADRREYQDVIARTCTAIRSGGLLHMAYMVGSTGYQVGGVPYPAYPVTPDEAATYVGSNGMTVLHNTFTASTGGARHADTTHSYEGMGILIARRD